MQSPIIAVPSEPKLAQYGVMYKDPEIGMFRIYDGKKYINFEPREMISRDFTGFVDDETGIIPGLPTVILKRGEGVNISGSTNTGSPTTHSSGKVMQQQAVPAGKPKIKHIYCPANGEIIVYDVTDEKVTDLCGKLDHEKYSALIIRCTTETSFDGVKNLLKALADIEAPLDQITEFVKKYDKFDQ